MERRRRTVAGSAMSKIANAAAPDGGKARRIYLILRDEILGGTLQYGRLLIQTEGAEVFYRNLELHPLPRNAGS